MSRFTAVYFEEAESFIKSIPEPDKSKVLAAIDAMQTDIEAVHIKSIRSTIRELIVKKYRILFFIKHDSIYFTNGFIKKTQKTPQYEIEYAEKILKMMR